MIGVALVGFITILASSTTKAVVDQVDKSFRADYVVDSGQWAEGGFSPELADDLAALPEVDLVSPIRVSPVAVGEYDHADRRARHVAVRSAVRPRGDGRQPGRGHARQRRRVVGYRDGSAAVARRHGRRHVRSYRHRRAHRRRDLRRSRPRARRHVVDHRSRNVRGQRHRPVRPPGVRDGRTTLSMPRRHGWPSTGC